MSSYLHTDTDTNMTDRQAGRQKERNTCREIEERERTRESTSENPI